MCVCSVCYMDIRPGGSVVRQRQLLVGYGMCRVRGLCVSVSSFGEELCSVGAAVPC